MRGSQINPDYLRSITITPAVNYMVSLDAPSPLGASDLPGAPLTDYALVSVADQLFQSLDAEVANGDNARSW